MTEMEVRMRKVFGEVQVHTACHQRNLQILVQMHNKNTSDFADAFLKCMTILCNNDIQENNCNFERCLSFAVKLIIKIGANEENPLVERVLYEMLRLCDLAKPGLRYYSCKFLSAFFNSVDDSIQLSNALCDEIQAAMLERMQDTKGSIRLVAVLALLRLQSPNDAECPVINRFIKAMLNDPLAEVRRVVIESIAPGPWSLNKMELCLRDCNYRVRRSAFGKFACINPKRISIACRQAVLITGFAEKNEVVHKTFVDNLLQSWFVIYEKDYLKFMEALTLDEEEQCLDITLEICKMLMAEFFKTHPITDILSDLPIDDNKTIPHKNLTYENATYWAILHEHFNKHELLNEYLDIITPDLTPFCRYVEQYIEDVMTDLGNAEKWVALQKQSIMHRLFDIAKRYDIADKTGRQTLKDLVVRTLFWLDIQLNESIIFDLVTIWGDITTDVEDLSQEMCQLVIDMKPPTEPTQDDIKAFENTLTSLRKKLNAAGDHVEAAITAGDFNLATEREQSYIKLKNDVAALANRGILPKPPDNNSICRSLDIINALLKLPQLTKINVALVECRDEFRHLMSNVDDLGVYEKIFKCICLFTLHEREAAEINLQMIISPIVLYFVANVLHLEVLVTAIRTSTQLLLMYGPEIFPLKGQEENSAMRRKLFSKVVTNLADTDISEFNVISAEDLIEVICGLLDDKDQVIRDTAGSVLTGVINTGIAVNSRLVTNIVLKWYNHEWVSCNARTHQLLGVALVHYAKQVKDSGEVILNAVLPVVCAVGHASPTSPLSKIDLDNLVKFLTVLMSGEIDNHKKLILSLINKIAGNRNDTCAVICSKLLLLLNIPDDKEDLLSLNKKLDLLLVDVKTKQVQKNLKKCKTRLLKDVPNIDEIPLEEILEENTNSVMQPTEVDKSATLKTLEEYKISNAAVSICASSSNGIEEIVSDQSQCSSMVSNRSIRKRKYTKSIEPYSSDGDSPPRKLN